MRGVLRCLRHEILAAERPEQSFILIPSIILGLIWGVIFWVFNFFWVGKYKFDILKNPVYKTATQNKIAHAEQVMGVDWNGVQKEFDTLYKSASIPNLNLRGGYHCINLSNDKRSIEIDDAKASGSLGSHGVTWREFRNSADRAYSNNNLNTTGQRNAAADYAGLISKPINIDPDMPPIQWPWMSAMRNKIKDCTKEQRYHLFRGQVTLIEKISIYLDNIILG